MSNTLSQLIEDQLEVARSSDFSSMNETGFKQAVLAALIQLRQRTGEAVCVEIVSEYPVCSARDSGDVGRIDLLVTWDRGGRGENVSMAIIELKYVPLMCVRDDRVWALCKKRYNHRSIAEVTKLEDRRKALNQFVDSVNRDELWTLKVLRGPSKKCVTAAKVGDDALRQARGYAKNMRTNGLAMRHLTEDLTNVQSIGTVYYYALIGVGNLALLSCCAAS